MYSKGKWGALGTGLIIKRSALAVAVALSCANAMAIDYDVPSQDMGQALKLFSEQSGAQVIFRSDSVAGKANRYLRGEYDVAEGLEILLQDTGLSHSTDQRGVIMIRPRQNEEVDSGGQKTSNLGAGNGILLAQNTAAAGASGQTNEAVGSNRNLSDADLKSERLMNEIVVTARKRSESLSDIPMSINVMSADMIQKSGARNFTDLLTSVPSLSAYQNGPGRTKLAMRGVTTGRIRADKPQNKETVGLYFDDIPISVNGFNPESALNDLERIEVLRGPQGTLYGAGSMTGTVKMVSRKPNLNEVEGKVEADLSFTQDGGENYGFKGVANIPVVEDVFALRINANFSETEGYIDNYNTGEKNLNDDKTLGVRVASRWLVSDRLTIDASAMLHDFDNGGRPDDELNNRTRGSLADDGYTDEMTIYNITLKYDLEFAELVSSSSYFDKSNENRVSLEVAAAGLGDPATSILYDTTDVEDFSQELRLSSTGDGPFQWVLGAYYNDRSRYYLQDGIVPGLDESVGTPSSEFGAPPDRIFYGFQDVEQEQFAVFGEASYSFGDLTVTAGLRWFDWSEDFSVRSSGLANGGVTTVPESGVGVLSASEDGVNPKLNLSYRINDDVMIYAQSAKGFRFGGINDPVPFSLCEDELARLGRTGSPVSFGPDEAWNHEIGLKGMFMDQRLSINASYFNIVWDDIQSTRSLNDLGDGGCAFSFTDNAGRITSEGIELEITAYPTHNLTVSLGSAFIDSQLDEDSANFSATKGDRSPYVAEITVSATAEYSFSINDALSGYVWGSAQYVDDRDTGFDKQSSTFRVLDSYQTASIRTGLYYKDWELALYANNVFDSDGELSYTARGFVTESSTHVRPRTVGLTIRTNF